MNFSVRFEHDKVAQDFPEIAEGTEGKASRFRLTRTSNDFAIVGGMTDEERQRMLRLLVNAASSAGVANAIFFLSIGVMNVFISCMAAAVGIFMLMPLTKYPKLHHAVAYSMLAIIIPGVVYPAIHGGALLGQLIWLVPTPLAMAILYDRRHAMIVFSCSSLTILGTYLFLAPTQPIVTVPSFVELTLPTFNLIAVSIILMIIVFYFQKQSEEAYAHLNKRNQAIEEILNHVKTGFFRIGPSQKIESGYSKACLTLFQRPSIVAEALPTLLSSDIKVQESLELAIAQIFDDEMPEQANLSNLPQQITMSNGKILSVHAQIIRNEYGKVTFLLFNLNDITDKILIERENEQNRQLISILRNRSGFVIFLDEFENFFDLIESEQGSFSITLRRQLHSLKGNAAAFGLLELSKHIHHLEAQKNLTKADLQTLRDCLDGFVETHRLVFSDLRQQTSQGTPHFNDRQKLEFEQLASRAESYSQELASDLRHWCEKLEHQPILNYLEPLEEQLQTLAKQMNKTVELQVQGDNPAIGPHFDRIVQLFPTVFRNSLYHGIEDRSSRGNKPWPPKITIDIEDAEDQIHITITDDGRGIDLQSLREQIAKDRCLPSSDLSSLSDQVLIDVIFQDGFSTNSEANEIAGRGLGMAGLKAEIEALGGQVRVESEPGLFTRISLTVPTMKIRKSEHFAA